MHEFRSGAGTFGQSMALYSFCQANGQAGRLQRKQPCAEATTLGDLTGIMNACGSGVPVFHAGAKAVR